ncbi:MAG TPA: histidine phosphatase family protein [Phenylobacterium sp.]|jgi:broad specificity phosphatase PhoE|uniref:histidine phosphatase family protein n=1 Tax=Phenylobacterium sp. TaxID=1871053 RepID=UPI002D37264B|nr:histidine phosphatase family protein [Phenylobacterium sp.]HZZ66945.1 histidine phosphatase family protein [Phenylobacterium sp.]
MQSRWPSRLWIVRHGESAGNVARDLARNAGAIRIAIGARDVDVPLSELGETQAKALGRWFASQPENERPQIVITSTYRRAQDTAAAVRRAGGLSADAPPNVVDERLREREFGVLDRLTSAGIRELHPEQAELRRAIGKFYHRPPGGESWCDVILRLRSALDTISLHYPGKRVLLVGHQVVVLCLRYLLETLSEAELLAIDAHGDVVNCGVTEYRFDPTVLPNGALALTRYNFAAPLHQAGAPVTARPDSTGAAR